MHRCAVFTGPLNLIAFILMSGIPLAAQEEGARSIIIDGPLINIPITTGAPKQRIRMEIDGSTVRDIEVEFANTNPEFWVGLDVSLWQGRQATLRGEKSAIAVLEASEGIRTEVPVYMEKFRPQFHFSSRRGRLNDPNGLLHYDGEYHLFYQLHPYGIRSGSKCWGHAISRDLLHWKELPIAIHADSEGMMFSGSGVVDWNNTSGFQTGKEPPLVLIYTATGPPRDQRLAFSNDRGRTWTKYAGNPVLPEVAYNNRDPKVFWFEPGRNWVMILHCTEKGKKLPPIDPKEPDRKSGEFVIFTSPNLKEWRRQGSVIGFAECPDLFPMQIEGTEITKWIVHGGLGEYFIGDFDGSHFTRTSELLHGPYGGAYYAGQNYSDMPNGRVVQQGWAKMGDQHFPGMPFAQMMNIPCELTLRNTGRGPRLHWQPVREIEMLRQKHHRIVDKRIDPRSELLSELQTPFLDLHAVIDTGTASRIALSVRGVPFVIDVKKQSLATGKASMPMPVKDGRLNFRLLCDHSLIEVFASDGFKFGAFSYLPNENEFLAPSLKTVDGEAKIVSLDAYELMSVWPIKH